MSYIEIDFMKVKGFDNLTKEQQSLFIDTYKRHNSIVGSKYKESWQPIKVAWVKEKPSQYSYLKVDFKNGQWLHYTQRGDWY